MITDKNHSKTTIYKGEIYKAEDYIRFIADNSIGKTFNSGFSWTYKNVIQLKAPVMQE